MELYLYSRTAPSLPVLGQIFLI